MITSENDYPNRISDQQAVHKCQTTIIFIHQILSNEMMKSIAHDKIVHVQIANQQLKLTV